MKREYLEEYFPILNPLKIKPPIADFLYPPRRFKGVKHPKN